MFAMGETVGIWRLPSQRWIDVLGMEEYGWTPRLFKIVHFRQIVNIQNNTITIDVPLVDTLDHRYGEAFLCKAHEPENGLTTEVGVEDLRLETTFHGKKDENHAWNGILIDGACHSWVRRVTTKHFGMSAVQAGNGMFNTIEEVAFLEPVSLAKGGRRYPFYVSGRGSGILFQRCYASDGRHDFVSGSRVTGPHVWLDCLAVNCRADTGPHHRWATGLLWDNCQADLIVVQNRHDSGTGHGWAGGQCMLWNCVARSGQHVDAPPTAMSWSIGRVGPMIDGKYTKAPPRGWFESAGAHVIPRSLYLQQLADRLGPEAVEAVTTPLQRKGSIYEALESWEGEGRLPSS